MNYIYKVLLQFCLWCEIPLKLLKVYIINVQDCRYLGRKSTYYGQLLNAIRSFTVGIIKVLTLLKRLDTHHTYIGK